MQKMNPGQHTFQNSKSRRELKALRAAKARRHFELLQEKRLLENHLADFWNLPFEKSRNCAPGSADPVDSKH